jgi:hypothetical protein
MPGAPINPSTPLRLVRKSRTSAKKHGGLALSVAQDVGVNGLGFHVEEDLWNCILSLPAALRESKEFRSVSQIPLQYYVNLEGEMIVGLRQQAFSHKSTQPQRFPARLRVFDRDTDSSEEF